MSTVIASQLLANGLKTDFADTYIKTRQGLSDSRLGLVMDLGKPADNRLQEYAYTESAPHVKHWRMGDPVPEGAFGSVGFSVEVHNFARRVKWLKWDRKDDRTQSLYQQAQGVGKSAGLLPERMFFDLISGTPLTLPAVPLAPDGAAFFATTAGGADRFGVSSGNLLTGSGLATVAAIQSDYYAVVEQFLRMQDGQGQPLHSEDIVDAGLVLVHSAEDTEMIQRAFEQKLQGVVYGSNTAAAATSNLILDSSRNLTLWGSSRIATGDMFFFLKNSPTKATFSLDLEGVQEFESLEGGTSGDHTKTTGEEYVQWETRQGAGIALPYGAIKVNN
jgi:hypothetical protein